MPKSTYVLTPAKNQIIHYNRIWTRKDTVNPMHPTYIRMHSLGQEAANLIATRASWYICKAGYEIYIYIYIYIYLYTYIYIRGSEEGSLGHHVVICKLDWLCWVFVVSRRVLPTLRNHKYKPLTPRTQKSLTPQTQECRINHQKITKHCTA